MTDTLNYSIDFFKNVGQVVRVRLIVNLEGKLVPGGFVEFASADQAKKVRVVVYIYTSSYMKVPLLIKSFILQALEEKNGEYFLDKKIVLDVATKGAKYLPPK